MGLLRVYTFRLFVEKDEKIRYFEFLGVSFKVRTRAFLSNKKRPKTWHNMASHIVFKIKGNQPLGMKIDHPASGKLKIYSLFLCL